MNSIDHRSLAKKNDGTYGTRLRLSACSRCGQLGHTRHKCTSEATARALSDLDIADLRARFDARVDREGPVPAHRPELGPCHIWTGAKAPGRGYGHISFKGKTIKAHRVAFFLANGRWPEPCALHHCDGGELGCVRAEHIYEGTQLQNIRDRDERKRWRGADCKGERASMAKLTDAQVLEIRAVVGETNKAIGERFGVCASTVSMIRSGKRWTHLPRQIEDKAMHQLAGEAAARMLAGG